MLITGGEASGNSLNSAGLYDATNNSKSTTANALRVKRVCHPSSLLTNNQVLIVGGENAGGALASAELYHP